MAHSFRAHYFHIIWSTKHREPIITKEIQACLYDYLGGILHTYNGKLLEAGGMADHIHLLIGLNLPDKFSSIIRDMKAKSSAWLSKNLPYFSWQEGYGSFSVSCSSLERVKNYIKNQEDHHRTTTFEEEFLILLNKHQIKYDARFVLD